MTLIRYRTGIDRRTGKLLVGWPHCRQSMATILVAEPDSVVMLLDFAGNLRRFIGRNTVAPIVTKLYRQAFASIRRWEPEFRPRQVQLLRLDRLGGLALGLRGTYYPEGRLGNYAISEAKGAAFGVQAGELAGRDL